MFQPSQPVDVDDSPTIHNHFRCLPVETPAAVTLQVPSPIMYPSHAAPDSLGLGKHEQIRVLNVGCY